MLKRVAVAVALFGVTVAGFMGCDPPRETGQPTGTTRPTTDKKRDVDIKIRTPGADIDIERKADGDRKGVEVDVKAKKDKN